MKWYIVKQTSKATDTNDIFRGTTQIIYYGKNDGLIAYEGDFYNEIHKVPLANAASMVHDFGYKTERHAKRNHTYNHPDNNPYWESTVEIIAVEIVDGKAREVER